jgi:hypothetical protein
MLAAIFEMGGQADGTGVAHQFLSHPQRMRRM